jgi:hypothetical protein
MQELVSGVESVSQSRVAIAEDRDSLGTRRKGNVRRRKALPEDW